MTDKSRRDRLDRFQNLAIALLAALAALLFAQTYLSSFSASSLGGRAGAENGGGAAAQPPAALTAPVRLAVTGEYGRCGELALSTDQESFTAPGGLLREALGSAGMAETCSEGDFRAALDRVGVYYDFLSPLPLPLLSALVGVAMDGELTARRLLLAAGDDGTVSLYLQGGGSCFRCSTAVSAAALTALTDEYELGGAFFAFSDETGTALNPYSLLVFTPPTPPVLTAADSLTDRDALLRALGLNPHTYSRYPESDGTEVILEGDRSLRIQPNGTAAYSHGTDSSVTVSPAHASGMETVTGTAALLRKLLGTGLGDASLYLTDYQARGTDLTLRFGYQVGGVPIRFADGGAAAEVVLSGTTVVSLTLRFRSYTAAEEPSLLLPLRQALAIASRYDGAELVLGYADGGESRVEAVWLAE